MDTILDIIERHKRTLEIFSILILSIAGLLIVFEKELTSDIVMKKHLKIIKKIESNKNCKLFSIPDMKDTFIAMSDQRIKTYTIDFRSKSLNDGKEIDKGIKVMQDIFISNKSEIDLIDKGSQKFIAIKKKINKTIKVYEFKIRQEDFQDIQNFINKNYLRS